MRSRTIKIFFDAILGVGIIMMTACAGNGVLRDRIDDYKLVNECPSLKIPTGVSAEPRSEDYYIPERDGKSFRTSQNAANNLKPSTSNVEGKMNIKKLALDARDAEKEKLKQYDPWENVVKASTTPPQQLPKLPVDENGNIYDFKGRKYSVKR